MCAKHLFSLAKRYCKNLLMVAGARRQSTEQCLKWWQRGRSISLMHGVHALLFASPAARAPWLIKMNERKEALGLTAWSISLPVPGGVADRQCCLLWCIPSPETPWWLANQSAGRRVNWWYSFLIMIRRHRPPPVLFSSPIILPCLPTNKTISGWMRIATSQAPPEDCM